MWNWDITYEMFLVSASSLRRTSFEAFDCFVGLLVFLNIGTISLNCFYVYVILFWIGTIPDKPPVSLDEEISIDDPIYLKDWLEENRKELMKKGSVSLYGNGSQFEVSVNNFILVTLKATVACSAFQPQKYQDLQMDIFILLW